MVAGSFCSAKALFQKLMYASKTGRQLVAAVVAIDLHKNFLWKWFSSWQLMFQQLIQIKGYFENEIVAGCFALANLFLQNWLVAGSCCSSHGSKYKDALKIRWQLVAFVLTKLFFYKSMCASETGLQLVAAVVAVYLNKRIF